MEGNAHLTTRLSHREDAEIICGWDSQKTLHETVLELMVPEHQHTHAYGVANVSPRDVRRLRDAVQHRELGLSPAEREDTLTGLDKAFKDFAAEDLDSPVFEYSWAADL